MMVVRYAQLGLLIALFQYISLSSAASLPTDPTYHAGIVEFAHATTGTQLERLLENVKGFKAIIESNATTDLDILVFPEHTLNNDDHMTYVPDPAAGIAPCDNPDYHYFFSDLSCAARSRGLYVVINVLEKEHCKDRPQECNANGINIYNTNVVFDRQGRVISRYRKTHLYGIEWYKRNVRPKPELATFATDFGVTFGHFICFDMLFYEPSMVLVKELNITDIIYPTYWFSELPFLTAVQIQEGWSYANNVNLLAADSSNPSKQNTGSGIYAGKLGRLAAVIHEEPTTKLLKARVPKHWHRDAFEMPPAFTPLFVPQLETPRYTKLQLLRDYNVDIFITKLLPQDVSDVSETLCHGGFCCKFDVRRTLITESTQHSAYRYRLAAYSGGETTHQRVDPSAVSVCALIACTSDQLYSCGHIFPEGVRVGNKYYFNTVNVSGTFRHAKQRVIMPSSVDALMLPVPVTMYDMQEVERSNDTQVSIYLNSPKADLLTFGLWANYYSTVKTTHNQDPPQFIQPPKPGKGAAATLTHLGVLLPLMATLAAYVSL